MNLPIRIGLTVGAVAAVGGLFAAPAVAASERGRGDGDRDARVVFVQNDDLAGNTVYAYDRHSDGALTLAGSYPTQGLGGALAGSVVDHLASQGALALDPSHDLLFAVNAGSNTVSVFGVRGDRLSLRQILPSGGTFPVSVAVSGDLVYVLNARDGGSISGYRVGRDRVSPIAGSVRPLGLDPTATPEFTHTPGQVTFTPDGRQLLVTTKANGNDVDVFPVKHDGSVGAPSVNELSGAVPFAAAFDRAGHLLLAEAGTNSVASFDISDDGTLVPIGVVGTGQTATCWITSTRHYAFASNAGSATVTGMHAAHDGALSAIGQTSTGAGTVDSTASSNGHFLYVQSGGTGNVDAYRVNHDGTLTPVGTVTVPNAVGGEGIVAS